MFKFINLHLLMKEVMSDCEVKQYNHTEHDICYIYIMITDNSIVNN